MKTSIEKAKIAAQALADKKGHRITVLDIQKISSITDYFIIADGENQNQVQAMADSVNEQMQKNGEAIAHTEGYSGANWILMDYGDVVVHVFDKENRLFYDLERIWRDGQELTLDELNVN